MFRGGSCTHSSRCASHQLNDGRLCPSNMVAPKKINCFFHMSSSSIFLIVLFCLPKDNRDILNHFIEFMTYEMWWRMPRLSVTIELILHTPKEVFHWNVASMSHVHYFLWLAQILWVCFSKTMWTSATYFLALSWQVTCRWRITNKMTLRPKYSRLCSSQTCTPLLYHSSFRSSTKGLK
jgi:hypothetical protein